MQFVSPEEAVAGIESGHRIYLHGGAATPTRLVDALMQRATELRDVEVVHLHTEAPAPYVAPGMELSFRHNALFIGPNVRSAVQDGRADYTPVFLSEIPRLFRPEGVLPLDAVLLQVSPPDERGMCSLGVSVDCAYAAMRFARTVIAQVNQRMPRTLGAAIHTDAIHFAVEADEPLPEHPMPALTPEMKAIGREVAALVPDGGTLQAGIGGVPNAVLAELSGHRDLGVHTEMFSDGLIPLIESGVVNGSRKSIHRGLVVSAFVVGTQRLYEFVHNNAKVELHPVTHTNDIDVISSHDRMVAVNSALAVDLTGQVSADSLGTKFYSGIGGQLDFIRGAARSRHGVPVIALPSTAKSGTLSRIVPVLAEGSGVVTTRGDVHWVVTEFGARNLHGRTIRERARMLIDIAHPDFRAELEQRAFALGYLRAE
jgi:4-hydroxybutyrate CoA-transferase